MKIVPDMRDTRLSQIISFLTRCKQNARAHRIIAVCILIVLTVFSCIYLATQPRRYAIFAGYSPDGSISPYVIYYLKGLNAVSDGVVYITDSPLSEKAQKQVEPYIIHGEFQRHGEYDWGSYKRGYQWLKKRGLLNKADELVLANDSVYAPLDSFKPMFQAMDRRQELDFWGNTQNSTFNPHLQSYFLVLRRPVLRSKNFDAFINNIKAQPHHSLYITEYEIKLTPMLQNLGYKWGSYIPRDFIKTAEGHSVDPNSYPVTLIGKYDNQFLKRRTFTDKLPIEESRTKLMKLLKQKTPEIYNNIVTDFPEAGGKIPAATGKQPEQPKG